MDQRIKSQREQTVQASNNGREVPDLIRELYEVEKLTQEQIAERLGVARSTVVRWMVDFDIPTRDRRALAPAQPAPAL